MAALADIFDFQNSITRILNFNSFIQKFRKFHLKILNAIIYTSSSNMEMLYLNAEIQSFFI